jgi:hypothetical protein
MKAAVIGFTAVLAMGAIGGSARLAIGASTTPERRCQKARLDAAAKYLSCHQKVLAKQYSTDSYPDLQTAMRRCRATYQLTWPKLQARSQLAGTSCAQPRFADQGDGTVLDNLTSLVWEKKSDDGGVHDKDDLYTWSAPGSFDETGTAFSSFLPALDAVTFAGSAGWRVPTLAELQTILPGVGPCPVPCIDPIFGLTSSSLHWTSTSGETPEQVAFVSFSNGQVSLGDAKEIPYAVRAVRGRL